MTYIVFTCIIELFSATKPLEGFYITLPLVLITLFLSQITCCSKNVSKKINWAIVLNKNIFFITYCFLIGGLISVIFNFNNIDLLGWWPLFLYLLYFSGLVFSLAFSIISWTIKYHNHIYNSVFYMVIVFLMIFLKMFPHYIFGNVDVGLAILMTLLSAHLLLTILFKLLKIPGDDVQ